MATKREIPVELTVRPEYAWCRGLSGHSWVPPSVLYAGPKATIILELTCRNCKAHRRDMIDHSNGLLSSRGYQYSEGYLMKDLGRPKPGQMRALSLTALLQAKRVDVRPWKAPNEKKKG